MDEKRIGEEEKEAIKFLERDFNQSYQQMRHYDGQMFEILKFMFTGYTTVIGVAIGLYEFGLKENKTLTAPAIAILCVGLIFGLFMFALTIRNRVYFVQVARYINEQRKLFLVLKPMGFQNESRMYTNCSQPPYFNFRSSQAWFAYIVAALNATLVTVLSFITCMTPAAALGIGIGLFLAQLVSGIVYLKSREGKSASGAVFGKE